MASYFVTGATGYIGGSVAAALIDAGHKVRGLVRNSDAAARLNERGITPVLGTLDDVDLLTAEARAADGVINTASADHAAAAQALIDGLVGSGKPFLHTSGSSVVGDDVGGNAKSELIYDELSNIVVHPSKQARHEINQMIRGAADRGVRSVVICPSLIYGFGRGLNPASIQIPFLVAQARTHDAVQIVGAGRNAWSNVHIEDVVGLYLLALENAPAGSFYCVCRRHRRNVRSDDDGG
jgi:nucleoside-diphosphate-sugar epimerase